jgi:thiamine biosynthesis protein ThiI
MRKEKILMISLAGEIQIKSNTVRKRFTNCLIKNIKLVLKNSNKKFKRIEKGAGKLFVFTESPEKLIPVLKKVFGIHSISIIERTKVKNLQEIKEQVLSFALKKLKKVKSFGLRVKRIGKHDFSSQKIAVECGKIIQEKIPIKVDLTNPEKELFVLLEQDNLILFSEKIFGVNGFPIGVQGMVGIEMTGKKRDVLTAWLLMRKGCIIKPIILRNKKMVEKQLKLLKQWNNFQELQPISKKNVSSDLIIVSSATL